MAQHNQTEQYCPGCLEQGEASPSARLIYDEWFGIYGCDCCNTMWWPSQLEAKWQEVEQRFRDANKAREVA